MARLVKEKGIYEAIEAFKLLKQEFENLRMAIAGVGPELNRLKTLYSNINGLDFLGYVHDKEKYQLLCSSTIFVSPSYRKGMPNSILEAMACGLPIVTYATGGIKDFFIDGQHGFLISDINPEIISECIKNLLNNTSIWKHISNNNIAFAYKHFSSPIVIKKLNLIYDAILNDRIITLPRNWYS